MNTNLLASLLFATFTTTLSAQDLTLEATASARTFTATVRGASEGAMVIMVLGMSEAAIKLPGDLVLGVQPDMLLGVIAKDEFVTFRLPMLMDVDEFAFFAQAAALHPRLPIEAPGTITLSRVAQVAVPAGGGSLPGQPEEQTTTR